MTKIIWQFNTKKKKKKKKSRNRKMVTKIEKRCTDLWTMLYTVQQ